MLSAFLLSINCVSASEINNTIASEDTNTIDLSSDTDIEDNLQTTEENDELTLTDTDVLDADSATYSNLAEEIHQSGNIKLTHKNYTYDTGATAITIIEDNKVIDGDGAVIDMKGSTIRAFDVTASGVTIKNLTIKNAKFYGDGGAIYFKDTGSISNCNFTNNTATYGGSIHLDPNFTDKKAGILYFNVRVM